jgi:hypothetical protein
MLRYENSILKICIRTIKHYTDIEPTVDHIRYSVPNKLFVLQEATNEVLSDEEHFHNAIINNWCLV